MKLKYKERTLPQSKLAKQPTKQLPELTKASHVHDMLIVHDSYDLSQLTTP
jgi:hypothetical protein